MKRKINIILLSILLVTTSLIPNFAIISEENVIDEKPILDTESGYVELENCEGEYTFSNPDEIKLISEKYGLEDSSEIEEIRYVPIATSDELIRIERKDNNNTPRKSAGTTYYIKNKSNSEAKGDLIRSSWYRYPGGSMSISESVSRKYFFSAISGISVSSDVVKSTLTSSYGFSLSKSDTVTDTQEVSVKKYCKRNVKAYVCKKKLFR